jgi:pantoate--beta-alanine ligase
MHTATTIADIRTLLATERSHGRPIGFVPTMGALHAGHAALIERSVAECAATVVSVFLNPLQFGAGEDLERYPAAPEADRALCRDLGVNHLFVPTTAEMYPRPLATAVRVEALESVLCGASRRGHFAGVCTVVAKLLNIVQPDALYLGEKDYQQLVILRRMARDLSIPVAVHGCPTVREPDGLALSSRNAYLSPEERAKAVTLSRALFEAADAVRADACDADDVVRRVTGQVAVDFDRIDYVAVVDPDTLQPVRGEVIQARLCAAAYLGSTRLIDNVALDATARLS